MTLMSFSLEEDKVRALLKELMLELMAERPEIFQAILIEAIEDAGLLAAIQDAESSGMADRTEIDVILGTRG